MSTFICSQPFHRVDSAFSSYSTSFGKFFSPKDKPEKAPVPKTNIEPPGLSPLKRIQWRAGQFLNKYDSHQSLQRGTLSGMFFLIWQPLLHKLGVEPHQLIESKNALTHIASSVAESGIECLPASAAGHALTHGKMSWKHMLLMCLLPSAGSHLLNVPEAAVALKDEGIQGLVEVYSAIPSQHLTDEALAAIPELAEMNVEEIQRSLLQEKCNHHNGVVNNLIHYLFACFLPEDLTHRTSKKRHHH